MVQGEGTVVESLNCEDAAESPRRPRHLEFTGHSNKEKRTEQGEGSGDLRNIPLECKAEYLSERAYKETASRK